MLAAAVLRLSPVLQEHAIVDGHIGDTSFLEYFTLVGEYNRTVDTVIRGFKKLGECAVPGVVLA